MTPDARKPILGTTPTEQFLWQLTQTRWRHMQKRREKPSRKKRMTPPNNRQLEHWAEVCRYMDGQPYRSVAAPFPDDPAMSFPLLKNMSRFKLVRHRNSDCTWQVAQNWHAIIERLAQGITEWEKAKKKPKPQPGKPFVVDYNIDTMYVNVLAEEMPFRFMSLCQQYKDKAQIDFLPAESPWLFGGTVLNMLPNGKAVSKNGGVSWGFILRNDLVEIRLRKKPMSGIVAIVHFLAKGLWLNSPKTCLDQMKSCLKTMWADPDAFNEVTFQLSQIHLCADIAHFPLNVEHLPRLVTHSFKRTIHTPSREDLDLDDSVFSEGTSYSDDDGELYDGDGPDGWDEEYADPADDIEVNFYEEDDAEEEEDTDEEEEAQDWDEDGGKVHWRGKQPEGFGFSPAGARSAAWYDKILEERKSRKGWMRVIHEAGGWKEDMQLTRLEYRFRRPILGALEVALGNQKGQRWYDDPYVALEHLGDLWAFAVGLPPEHDYAPDVTYRGWMRLATVDPNDNRRSRWPTSALWEIVQRVPFSQGTPKPLRKAKEAKADHEHIDVEIRGLLISRAMLRETYRPGPANLAAELADFRQWAGEYEQKKPGLNFAEEVRERARMNGMKVPYKEPLVLFTNQQGRKRVSEIN